MSGSQPRSNISELPGAAWPNYDNRHGTPSAHSPANTNWQNGGEMGAAEIHQQPIVDLKGKSVVRPFYDPDALGMGQAADQNRSPAEPTRQGSPEARINRQLSNIQNMDDRPEFETMGNADTPVRAWPSVRNDPGDSSIYGNELHYPGGLRRVQGDVSLANRSRSPISPVEHLPIVSPLTTYPTRTNSTMSLPEPSHGVARAILDTLTLLEGTPSVQESARIGAESWAEGLIRIRSEGTLRTAGAESSAARSSDPRVRLPVPGEEVEDEDTTIIEHEDGSIIKVISANNGEGGFF
jgi:hypothetical protein